MPLSKATKKLFDAFRRDHAILGRGLHMLRTLVLAGDTCEVRRRAVELDAEAGPHIAFEEEDFYPALRPFLDSSEIDQMYNEHALGQALLADLMSLEESTLEKPDVRQSLVSRIEAMESHVSECGELFGAMGGLEEDVQERLYANLERWQESAPRWRDRPIHRQR